jgi:hypothetical protein
MAQTYYDVVVVEQADNPICWMASLAMVDSYWSGSSVGIGAYTDGFDPAQACIGNPAVDVVDFQNRMQGFGFQPVFPDSPLTAETLAAMSAQFGPLVYFHNVNGFPYLQGPGQGPGAHAIVITGTDVGGDGDGFWFNNPWGDKDSWADAAPGLAAAADPSSASFSLYFRTHDDEPAQPPG